MAWSLRVGCRLQVEGVLNGLLWAVVREKGNSPKMRSHRQVCAMPAPNVTHFEGGRGV